MADATKRKDMGNFLAKYWKGTVLSLLLAIALSILPVWTRLPAPAQTLPAQTPQPPLQVVTRIIPPLVIQENDKLSGFSIELWRLIAAEMGLEFKMSVLPTVTDLLNAVETRRVDAAIAAISITSAREQRVDFSFPILTAGLQIMVREPKENGATPNLLRTLFSPGMLQILGFALLMVVLIAHSVWLVERRHQESMISKSYFPGIFEAVWWAASTLATQADQMPRGALTRILAVIWMFTAVIFVALFTAAFTTNMTIQQLQGQIQGVNDLAGRVVGTTTGSTGAAFLRDRNLRTQEFPKIDRAYEALLNHKIDAIVSDAPVLLYYAAHDGKGKVQLVGNVLQEENYGIALQNGGPYRKRINQALLKLRENGTYQVIYDQYFKSEESQ